MKLAQIIKDILVLSITVSQFLAPMLGIGFGTFFKILRKILTTVVIVPITSTIRNYPYRVLCSVAGREGEIATDQIRTVDKSRLKRKIGDLNFSEIKRLREVFQQMFCE